jgi:hypothetical protein
MRPTKQIDNICNNEDEHDYVNNILCDMYGNEDSEDKDGDHEEDNIDRGGG